MESPENTNFAFTDGSCLTNPGPRAISIQSPLKKPIYKRRSILLGELVAVQIALEYFLQYLDISHSKRLKIFSDSQSTFGVLTLNWKKYCYKDITTEIQQTITTLVYQKRAEVEIVWTPSHASFVGNAIADALAKEAATEVMNQPECRRSTTIQEAKEDQQCREYMQLKLSTQLRLNFLDNLLLSTRLVSS